MSTNSKANKIHHCIYTSKYESVSVISLGSLFKVNYVASSKKSCVNFHFPSIHITTQTQHDGWLHIIRTDSCDANIRCYIDTPDPKIYPLIYPFYTKDQDYYDAPIWHYKILKKPFSYWHGHVYAVEIDQSRKSIKLIGGVHWGFTFKLLSIYPQAVYPKALLKEDVLKDLQVLRKMLKEYKFTT